MNASTKAQTMAPIPHITSPMGILNASFPMFQFGAQRCLQVPQFLDFPIKGSSLIQTGLSPGLLDEDVRGAYLATVSLLDHALALQAEHPDPADEFITPLVDAANLQAFARAPYLNSVTTPQQRFKRQFAKYLAVAQTPKQVAAALEFSEHHPERNTTRSSIDEYRQILERDGRLRHGYGVSLETQRTGQPTYLAIDLRLEGFRALLSQRDHVLFSPEGMLRLSRNSCSLTSHRYLDFLLGDGKTVPIPGLAPHDCSLGAAVWPQVLALSARIYAADPELFQDGFTLNDFGVADYDLNFDTSGKAKITAPDGRPIDAANLQLSSADPEFVLTSKGGPLEDLPYFEILWSDIEFQLRSQRAMWDDSPALEVFAEYFNRMGVAVHLEIDRLEKLSLEEQALILWREYDLQYGDDKEDSGTKMPS